MSCTPARFQGASAGFTLIELLVALALFALISLAGVRLVETVIGVQERTDSRTERLAELQRALYLATADFEQLTAGPELKGPAVLLTRGSAAGNYDVVYRLDNNALVRRIAGVDRVLIANVNSVQWRFLKDRTWTDQPTSEDQPGRPRAIELTVNLRKMPSVPSGTLRRVVELPGEQ